MRHFAAAFLTMLLTGAASAQERTLFWKALDVTAHLEADASLHVVERHTIVFDGAWNGGERSFNIRPGQSISLMDMRRIDGSESRKLSPGDLSDVGEYTRMDDTIRWRTRMQR